MSDAAGTQPLTARVGEMRRLTFMYCDVVGSTELSRIHSLEAYHDLMEGYRRACFEVIEERFEGHIVHRKGDGVLSAFGYPVAHENDAERAVRAGLALVREVGEVRSPQTGEALAIRVGVHNGAVYRKIDEDELLGFATNIGARYETLAAPGTVVVSDEVRRLVEAHFELEAGEPELVKGSAEPLMPFRVVGERRERSRPEWLAPLIGRESELAELRRACATGRGGVLVQGEAGVGKTRLVAAFLEKFDEPVVRLHGSPFHVDAGLHPIRGLIEARCGIRHDATGAERLASLAATVDSAVVPLIASVLGIEPSAGYVPAPAEGQRLEEQVNDAILEYVKCCKPGLVVAEDLHWFDDASRAILTSLIRAGVRVVATSRRPEGGLWQPIELRPLTLEDRLALIDAIALGLPEEERASHAARSDGIPLYLEELVRAGPAGAHPIAPVPGSVPAALYEPLVARLYATPDALPVAAAAAAAGQVVERTLLAATTALAEEQLESTLGTLVATHILEPVDDGAFRFRHELLREVAYELQPPSWRRMVHGRLSDVLLAAEPGDWYVVAAHLERAERHSEAADAYLNTAEWARRRGATVEAIDHLTRAIELVEPLGDVAREVALRLRRGMLTMSTENVASADASRDLDRCLALAAADPRSDEMFGTLIALWAYYLSRAELGRAREISASLRETLSVGRAYFGPQNRAGFAMLDWFDGDFAAAAGPIAEAVDELPAFGKEDAVAAAWFVPNDPTVAMFTHLGLARFMRGDVAGADQSFAHARDVAAVLEFPQGPWSSAYATWLNAWMWMETRAYDRADDALAEAAEAAEQHGFGGWELIMATHAVTAEALRDLAGGADGETLAAHADALAFNLEVWEQLGLRIFLPFYLTTLGALLARAGEPEAARARYDESLAFAAETGMRFYDAETLRRLAQLEADPRPALEAALDVAQRQGARPFELRIALDLDDSELLERVVAGFGERDHSADLELARARLR